MRNVIITASLLIVSFAVQAQFTLTPQIGLEQSKTKITVNDLATLLPLGAQFSPQAMLRLEYKFKNNHGPFAGISTSRSSVAINFNNADHIVSDFTAYRNDLKLRVDAGYQLKTKPIFLKKSSSNKNVSANNNASFSRYHSSRHKYSNRLNSFHKESDGEKSYSCKSKWDKDKPSQSSEMKQCGKQKQAGKKEYSKIHYSGMNKNLPYLKLQPLAGIAFIPGTGNSFENKTQGGQTIYTYNSGDWNTAFFTGMGFEFGKGKQQSFVISLQYLKGIGNLGNNSLETVNGSKTTSTVFSSKTTQWNLTAGFPVSLEKKPSQKKIVNSVIKCIKPDWQIKRKGCY